MEESSKAAGGRSRREVDVDDLLKNLNLHGEELHDVVLGKDEVKKWPEVKWLAAAKVLTGKSFSMESLKKSMHAAWNPARDVSFHAVGENLFVLQAHCLGDWNRIMLEGTWLFRGCALMVKPFDGATMAPTVIPAGVQAWIQIHKIPPLFRNKEVLNQLASRVGEVIASDLTPVQMRTGEFHRVRVKLDSAKPLMCFMPLAVEGSQRMFLQIKYEKLPRYCEHCGLMGHIFLECGTGEHAESELQYGPWMVAEEAYWRHGTPGLRTRGERDMGRNNGRDPVDGRGRAPGRGASTDRDRRKWIPKARGNSKPRKRTSEEAGLGEVPTDDLDDTAASPLKQPATAVTHSSVEGRVGARKKLDMGVEGELVTNETIPPPPPAYVPPKDLKKQKRAHARNGAETREKEQPAQKGGMHSMNDKNPSAASKEDRPAQ
ncbi:hypothetical protein QYE76_044197 [Lolium multiflorum]|uniref:Zinc knuckle CX2CX4HX4C domain-containing protein n=1 Tax=Lolium multiflorum TaxID=4521 RepID=A0AAD8TIC6_LOLMU|nr:hypothetical protein QYE76_044197 [Lolium multiflorum]